MACYHPAKAQRLANGDVKFVSHTVVDSSLLTLPCRQCVGCRLEHSRQWAIRCMDESAMHDVSRFATLTMSPESVVKYGRSLRKDLFQLFMKRLRKESSSRIRYFYCGEYTESLLPHYHALLFGAGFPDMKYFGRTKSGKPNFVSDSLTRLWPHGFSYLGFVNFESAAYVARYSLKKVIGSRDDLDRLIVPSTGEILSPEYVDMSRGSGDGSLVFDGGIGSGWYKKFKSDVYPIGNRIVRGRKMRPPVFYDNLYKLDDAVKFEELQYLRQLKLDKNDNTELRLHAKEEVALGKLKLYPRE